MQIFKRIDFKKKSPAQNLIEIAFIVPILAFLTLVMFEIALFWQDLNAIYSLNAEINANIANLPYTGLAMGDVCPAADETNLKSAISILKKKESRISLNDPTYAPLSIEQGSDNKTPPTISAMGKAPFAMYKYYSENTIKDSNGVEKPQISLWVDCRNPFENGVTTQLEFYHKTLIMRAKIPRFDGGKSEDIIPQYWAIASPKLNTLRHY